MHKEAEWALDSFLKNNSHLSIDNNLYPFFNNLSKIFGDYYTTRQIINEYDLDNVYTESTDIIFHDSTDTLDWPTMIEFLYHLYQKEPKVFIEICNDLFQNIKETADKNNYFWKFIQTPTSQSFFKKTHANIGVEYKLNRWKKNRVREKEEKQIWDPEVNTKSEEFKSNRTQQDQLIAKFEEFTFKKKQISLWKLKIKSNNYEEVRKEFDTYCKEKKFKSTRFGVCIRILFAIIKCWDNEKGTITYKRDWKLNKAYDEYNNIYRFWLAKGSQNINKQYYSDIRKLLDYLKEKLYTKNWYKHSKWSKGEYNIIKSGT